MKKVITGVLLSATLLVAKEVDDCMVVKSEGECHKSHTVIDDNNQEALQRCVWCRSGTSGDICVEEGAAEILPPAVFHCNLRKEVKNCKEVKKGQCHRSKSKEGYCQVCHNGDEKVCLDHKQIKKDCKECECTNFEIEIINPLADPISYLTEEPLGIREKEITEDNNIDEDDHDDEATDYEEIEV